MKLKKLKAMVLKDLSNTTAYFDYIWLKNASFLVFILINEIFSPFFFFFSFSPSRNCCFCLNKLLKYTQLPRNGARASNPACPVGRWQKRGVGMGLPGKQAFHLLLSLRLMKFHFF